MKNLIILFILFFLPFFVRTNHIKSLQLLQNPSFEIRSSNSATDWNTYNGNMSYNIICTNEPSSCATDMKKYDVTSFYGKWFVLMTSFNDTTNSAGIYQKIIVDINVDRADTQSLLLQLWYSSSGSSSGQVFQSCAAPEIHVYLGGQHLYGGVTNESHSYYYLNESVFQSYMEITNGMEFEMHFFMPNPECNYLPYLAVDNITLTWNYKDKNLFTEDILILVSICCVIIITICLAFFLVRRDNAKKRRASVIDIPIFPSCDWMRYQFELCRHCCHKENYELLHT